MFSEWRRRAGSRAAPQRYWLLRRFWLLLLALMVLGAAGGFASIVLSSPMYKTLLLMEVQNTNTGLPQNGVVQQRGDQRGGHSNPGEYAAQREFPAAGAERMQSETVPLAPTGRDIFSRLRQRIHPVTQDPLETSGRVSLTALKTFEARPVNHTRLIELSCESTSPDVAAQFLNAMAQEFVEDTSHSRIQTAQKTSEWLAAQIEETKARVQEAEEKLRDFVAASGNVFAGADATLDDTKLAQLKGELARIQSERIARQTRYELTLKNHARLARRSARRSRAAWLSAQLEGLKKDRAVLSITYTAKDKKVEKIDAEIGSVQNPMTTSWRAR
jgi:uncharacterized protein involved in exopolysaccharide biosynthesis